MKRTFLEKVTIPLLAPILALTGKAAHPVTPAHAVGAGQINNSRASTFTLKNGVEIYGGFTGTETLLSQRSIAPNTTILSGDLDKNDLVSANGFTLVGNNAFHVVTASGPGGLTLVGGGILIDAGNATFRDLTVFSNSAATAGAGMYAAAVIRS